jgi:hypothetical protein
MSETIAKGFTRLENGTDLATILKLPAGLQGPYLYLISRRGLKDPCVHPGELMGVIGRGWTQTKEAVAALLELGLIEQKETGHVFAPKSGRILERKVDRFSKRKPDRESERTSDRNSDRESNRNSDFEEAENPATDANDEATKEGNGSEGSEGSEGRPSTTAVEEADQDQNSSPEHPKTEEPPPPARVLPPVAPGRLASFGPRDPDPKPVPSQAQARNRPTGCEALSAAREENYMLLAAYFDRPNMSRYPEVLKEWQGSAASWTQFPTPYLEIVLNTARGLRPGVTESGPGFSVLALSNPSSLKIPDDIRAVLAQSRPSSAPPALRNSAAPRNPGVWLKGDGTPITVLEWYEDGACLTDRGDFPTALTRAWKPLLPLEMEAV